MSKEACMVVVDVGRSMGSADSDGVTRLDQAKAALRLLVQQKLLFGYKQDALGVVLVNTERTDNPLADDAEGYKHVAVEWHLQTPSIELLESIDAYTIEGREDDEDFADDSVVAANGDLLDAVLVAAQMVINFVRGRKYRQRVFLLTDASGGEIADSQQMTEIAASFCDNKMDFICIGIGFGEEKDDDDDDSDGAADSSALPRVEVIGGAKDRPVFAVENEVVLRQFGKLLGDFGAVFGAHSAISMMSAMRSRSIMQRAMFNGPLTLADTISIDIQLYSRCRKQALPSLKKASTFGTDECGPVKMDRIYVNRFKDGKTEEKKAGDDSEFGALDDALGDEGSDEMLEEVPEEERVRAYLYGKQYVPFTDEDIATLQYHSGEKHFSILAFVPLSAVERHSYMGAALVCVCKEDTSEFNGLMLSALIHACNEKSFGIVARLVARKNAAPKLVILEPRIKASAEFFIVNELPFYEDVRNYPFSSFTTHRKFQPTKTQLDAATDLVKALDLMVAVDSDSEDDEMEELLRPNEVFNPVLQRFYENLQSRALDPKCELLPLSAAVRKTLVPGSELFAKAEPAIKRFTEAFPMRVIPKKEVKKERKHWSELGQDIDEALDSVKMDDASMVDEMMTLDIDSALEVESVTAIGTVNPVSDFSKLIAKKPRAVDHFKRLCDEMFAVVLQMVEESFQDTLHWKAAECIERVRHQAILEEEPCGYNQHMRHLKRAFVDEKPDFWQLVADRKLTLLCNDDFQDAVDGCEVSREDCERFLQIEDEKPLKRETTEVEDSDDELDLV